MFIVLHILYLIFYVLFLAANISATVFPRALPFICKKNLPAQILQDGVIVFAYANKLDIPRNNRNNSGYLYKLKPMSGKYT